MKKLIASLLAITIVFNLVGCHKPQAAPQGENGLEISVLDAGYGTEWVSAMGKAFEEKLHAQGREVEVFVKPSFFDNMEAEIKANNVTTTDIFMTEYTPHMRLATQKLDNGKPIVADLTDVYDVVTEGQTKTIKERLYPSIEKAYNFNGTNKYYAFPLLNDTNGLYYNVDLFKSNNITVPRTSDELISVSQTIKNSAKVYPFIWYAGYWNFCTQVWWAQYETLETYNNFFKPDYNIKPSNQNSEYSKQREGRESALNILNSLVNEEINKGFNYPGCNSLKFTEVQTEFLLGKAAMIPNGGWIEREMQDEAEQKNIAVMKLPVNSAIAFKLGIDEDTLRLVISYVDDKTLAKPNIVSSIGLTADEVIKAVEDARGITCTSVSYAYPAIVPSYSDAIPLAKEFLAFTTTQEAQKIKFDTSGIMPFSECDFTQLGKGEVSLFKKSKIEVMNSPSYQVLSMAVTSDPFYFTNGLMAFNKNQYPAKKFGAQSQTDKMDVASFLSAEEKHIEDNWTFYLNEMKKCGFEV